MSPFPVSLAVFFCVSVTSTLALPKRPFSNGASSGAGEIPDEFSLDYRPFDAPLGKGSPGKEVFDNYDLDEGPRRFPEDYENEIHPQPPPQGGNSKPPLKPDDKIPEEKHPEDEPELEPEEEEDHEPPSHEKPKGGEETHVDEEEEDVGTKGGEEEPRGSEEEDAHGVEDEEKPHGDEEEAQEGEEEIPLPFKPALFSFQQVNHYIKQLEKAMDHVFKETLEEAALLNNTFANTTEEEVEVDGHKYKVQKSLIEAGDEDKNSTLFIEAISSVKEDEPEKNITKRSNPDSVPIQ
ncbi:unnamed protein product [Larinioides sclopetarius]|uniref:Uncharacterized protein n=2 Tax=Larinioides sclopetarius TaxID=280406 RepID=A0AAV2B8T4_9ARAC